MSGLAVPITLSAEAAAHFADARDDLFGSLTWYRAVVAFGLPTDASPRFVCAPGGVFPMQVLDGGKNFASLTTMYTCRFSPSVSSAEALATLARTCREFATTRIDALPADWAYLPACIDAARASGLAVRRFDHFGNWHEVVRGHTWASYLASRPGQLRETIRRKLRGPSRFELITGGEPLEPGIAAFEAVYRRSWKEPEPFPDFNAELMRVLAPLGLLRLGILHIGEAAVAAQLWIVERDRATVLKLAHDEDYKTASPGTVLTALMLRHLLNEEYVAEIDFGRGDDPYKAAWASQRRQRIGLMFANPLQPRGMVFLGRHALGRARAALRR